MNNTRKVILYIAMSLDGFIATKDDGLDFLSVVEQEGEDYSYSDFVNTVDTIIIGRRSYEKVLSMGYNYPNINKEIFVVTHAERPAQGNLKFYNGDLKALVDELKSKPGKDIYVDGGAVLVNELLKDNLIDEFYISVIPVLLGDGISLFNGGRPELNLKLVSSKAYSKGLVQLHYTRK
ncbi:MAG: dihydrofolate reductase family protein [Paludibacter sp.]